MTDSIRKRAVFDTNVFIAAYVARNAKSPTAELIRRWRNGEFDLFYCDEIIDEIREKFAEKEVSTEDTDNLIQSLHTTGNKYEITIAMISTLLVRCALIAATKERVIGINFSHFDKTGGAVLLAA